MSNLRIINIFEEKVLKVSTRYVYKTRYLDF